MRTPPGLASRCWAGSLEDQTALSLAKLAPITSAPDLPRRAREHEEGDNGHDLRAEKQTAERREPSGAVAVGAEDGTWDREPRGS